MIALPLLSGRQAKGLRHSSRGQYARVCPRNAMARNHCALSGRSGHSIQDFSSRRALQTWASLLGYFVVKSPTRSKAVQTLPRPWGGRRVSTHGLVTLSQGPVKPSQAVFQKKKIVYFWERERKGSLITGRVRLCQLPLPPPPASFSSSNWPPPPG